MRIGINASFVRKPNTGIGQVTVNFLKHLAGQKSEHKIFLYLEEDIEFKIPNCFKKRIFLPWWQRDDLIRKVWWEKYLLPKKAAEDECDAFFSLYQCPTVFDKKIRHVMLVHDIIPKIFPEYLDNWRKKKYWNLAEDAIRQADKIVCVSKRTEKDLIEHLGIGGERIAVAYIDADEIYKKNVSPEKSGKVMKKYKLKSGYIYNGGGLEKRKNAEGMLRAYCHLLEMNKKNPLVSTSTLSPSTAIDHFPPLVISGKLMPQMAPLITDVGKLAKELNLGPYVKILDFVPQADLPALYRNCSMFVYPSFYEGFGLPVLEAMNQGKPVITSKKSSLPEVGGDAVLYTDPGDYKDIAMVMKNVMVNGHLRKILSERGKERAKKFSWDLFSEKIFNLFQK